jgi:hypothetical protein
MGSPEADAESDATCPSPIVASVGEAVTTGAVPTLSVTTVEVLPWRLFSGSLVSPL